MASTEEKKVLTSSDVKTERDAERLCKQHIEAHQIDEYLIELANQTMETYEYTLTIKKRGWEEIKSITYGKDDPDGAYITGCLYICKHITLAGITGGASTT